MYYDLHNLYQAREILDGLKGSPSDRTRQCKMHRDGLSDIGKGRSPPDRAALAIAKGKHRHALARVIGAAPGRIATVVGGHDQEVIGAEAVEQLRQPAIELL